MRQLIPVGLLLTSLALGASIAACNDTAYQSLGGPSDEPVGGLVRINGVVTDSAFGGGIAGVRVAAGKYVTYADANGQWTLAVPVGTVTLSASPSGYERVAYTFEVVGPTLVNLQARRLAPMVQECVRAGDQVSALVIDLQGRKTVERWDRSQVLILDPAGAYRVGALNWKYEAIDYLTWKVTLGPISPGTTQVHWYVYDSDGHLFDGSCEPTEVTPQE